MAGAKTSKKLSIWGFLLLVIVYLAIIKGVGHFAGEQLHLQDGKLDTIRDVTYALVIPIGASAIFVYGLAGALGWLKPVFRETKPVRRWIWFIPIVFALAIVAGVNYPGLSDKGLGFTLALLLATQLVGWTEEGMFRGIGVTTLRQYNITEGKVALWSSVIFGAVHISNVIGGNPAAFGQAVAVAFAGYFFYLIRRVSGSNVLNSILHGLFDFTILTGTGIVVVGQTVYVGSGSAILVYVIVGIVLLVRRHKIEPARA
jgi:hypothetical protein